MTTTAKGRRNKEILIVALQICHQGRAVVFWMTAILPDIFTIFLYIFALLFLQHGSYKMFKKSEKF